MWPVRTGVETCLARSAAATACDDITKLEATDALQTNRAITGAILRRIRKAADWLASEPGLRLNMLPASANTRLEQQRCYSSTGLRDMTSNTIPWDRFDVRTCWILRAAVGGEQSDSVSLKSLQAITPTAILAVPSVGPIRGKQAWDELQRLL